MRGEWLKTGGEALWKSSEKNRHEYGKGLVEAISFREIEVKLGVPPSPHRRQKP
jgi:hypothetical protein